MKQKIYISGAITGRHKAEYESHFDRAELKLRDKWIVINPLTLTHDHDKSYESYMKQDLSALLKCDAIYMLTGFEFSKGALIEFRLATELKLIIMFEQ